jgi:hypothetical protein
MRVIGIVSVYNEELVVEACLRHHIAQGLELYLIDSGSTDGTVEIARKYLGHGVVEISTLPGEGAFDLRKSLLKKRDLARRLDADWFIHFDIAEMHLAPEPGQTLAQALETVDQAGYNAVNFLEFTFIPTLEAPDHAHTRFHETMRWYYPFLPGLPKRGRALYRVNGWKKQPKPVAFRRDGHTVEFPGQVIYPIPFRMRHYQFLSLTHATRKYMPWQHPVETPAGGTRDQSDISTISLPSCRELHEITDDGILDFSRPRSLHFFGGNPKPELDEREGCLLNRDALRAILNFVEGVEHRRI